MEPIENFDPQENEDLQDELYEHHNIKADKGQAPLRIDKFLMDRIPNTSRNKIQISAKTGSVLVNNVPVKPNYKVKPNDEISVVLPYPVREIELKPENIPLDIVYEDDHLAVINKQAGIVVHPGYGNYTGTLVNALMFHFNELPNAESNPTVRPGLVHRLDKNTTGIMVIAKTEDALAHLSKQFFDRTTDRRYQAIVWGDLKEDEGVIEGFLNRSKKDRKVMDVYESEEDGKYSLTRYKVLKRLGYVTLVECKLETGRTHQIRVHFKSIKHPLFNDPEYGGNLIRKGTTFSKYKQFIENCFSICDRQALHAKTLEFTHPATGERMKFNSELPADMVEILEKMERYSSANS
ncbi:RluA family pseudouridine synthase [Luteibaculum oceani]|uniref:Pseudouridine synthase n=1 Tax=Luteibaculum oceani TaxID=1294296 RepID=A0A5C6V9V6_9FLAO|nr:RluA family pseudouridine synthase [Luteibaculum oceani]TXC81514.1 RluA family pseudouridine synthase [Luteibaculum oceani]